MDEHDPEGDADHGELLIGIGRAIVHQQFIGKTVSGDSILEDFLEVVGIIIISSFVLFIVKTSLRPW